MIPGTRTPPREGRHRLRDLLGDAVRAPDDVRRGRVQAELHVSADDRRDDPRDPDVAYELAQRLRKSGDRQGAEAAYRRADERGHAGASYMLGRLLQKRHDLEGAEAAYRRADERGHPQAAYELGRLLQKRDDLEGAEAAYRHADKRRHFAAAYRLGLLLHKRGLVQQAEAAYRRAQELGHISVVASAAEKLNELRQPRRGPVRAVVKQPTPAPPRGAKQDHATREKGDRPTREKEGSAASTPARRALRNELEDAAATLGPGAERCLATYYGSDWLARVNDRRKSENNDRSSDKRLRMFEPGEVQHDPRAALSVIGWDPAAEAFFGARVEKARVLHPVAIRLYHHHKFVSDDELERARRALRELRELCAGAGIDATASAVCARCGKELATAAALEQHMADKHAVDTVCGRCGKELATAAALEQHMADKHAVDTVCGRCGKELATAAALEQHMADKHKTTPPT